jgi:D-tyrosyl-tRNA(Tyr) deacylase
MRALIQRVKHASVVVEGKEIGRIGGGLLIFLGIHQDDQEADLEWMAKKCAQLRVFEDDEGKMNLSLLDIGGEALVVSQFTLYGNCKKGNRPSFVSAAHPDLAEPHYERFCAILSEKLSKPVATGRFAADMQVDLLNDGPVTLWIER